MKITHDIQFEKRSDLDSFVRNNFGDDHAKNRDVVIEISSDEGAALSLSEKTSVYGAKIKIIKS